MCSEIISQLGSYVHCCRMCHAPHDSNVRLRTCSVQDAAVIHCCYETNPAHLSRFSPVLPSRTFSAELLFHGKSWEQFTQSLQMAFALISTQLQPAILVWHVKAHEISVPKAAQLVIYHSLVHSVYDNYIIDQFFTGGGTSSSLIESTASANFLRRKLSKGCSL